MTLLLLFYCCLVSEKGERERADWPTVHTLIFIPGTANLFWTIRGRRRAAPAPVQFQQLIFLLSNFTVP